MVSKIIACSFAVLVQTISAQVISGLYGPGIIGNNLAAAETAALAAPFVPAIPPFAPANAVPFPAAPLVFEAPAAPLLSCGFGLTLAELAANGGGFSVTSSSPITPNGVTVQSESLMFEGPLAVTGTMPFLGSVALEGPLPATGQGAVAYGCGNGNVGILSEDLPGVVAANNFPGPIGPNPALAGYNGLGIRGPFGPLLK